MQGAGAPGQAGAGELALDAITWVAGTAGPNDPSSTSGLMFYLTGYTITFKGHGSQQSFTTSVTNPYTNAVNPGLEGAVNGFLGDTGIPMSAGHYGFHPAPGVAGMLQVSFRPGH